MIKTALLGNPVHHSPSPLMYREYAAACGFGEYEHQRLAIESEDAFSDQVTRLFDEGFLGVNITSPYKRTAWRLATRLDETAAVSGAVNVLVQRSGVLVGYNTDISGAGQAMEKALGRELNRDDVVTVLGTGGAARAIVAFSARSGAKIRALYRSPESERTRSLKNDFPEVRVAPIEHFVSEAQDATIICNATPLGLADGQELIPYSSVARVAAAHRGVRPSAFCVVISKETPFLSLMSSFGASISGGVEMMVFQGAAAFEVWTGRRPAEATIQSVLHLVLESLPLRTT